MRSTALSATRRTPILLLTALLSGEAHAAPGDGIADRVLGQTDFSGSALGFVDSRGLHAPASIVVDRTSTPNRLYVADTANSRVLGWRNARGFRKGTPADLVIGQASYNAALCNRGGTAGAATLCRPRGLSVDAQGDLYVADAGNHRVLRFASPFTSGLEFGQAAEAVFGQASFGAGQCNRGNGGANPGTAESLCAPSATTVDAAGNLYVADGLRFSSTNHRLLVFDDPKAAGGGTPGTPGTPGDATADRVFGQAGFAAVACNRGGAPSASTLCAPGDVRIDGAGNLLVADTSNNRVLVFFPPLTDTTADFVYGQSDFVSASTSPGRLIAPTGVTVDPAGNVWVAPGPEGRTVYEYDGPVGADATVDDVFGNVGTFPSAKYFVAPTDVDVDAFGNVFVADGLDELGYHRVLRINDPFTTDRAPDGVVGQKGYATSQRNRVDLRSLSLPLGIAFDHSVAPPHVYVVDSLSNRVLGWENLAAFANGEAADLVLGQPSFKQHYCNQNEPTALATTLCRPVAVAVDAQGNVWVADRDNHRVLGFDPPFKSGFSFAQPASRVLGQADFTSRLENRGGAVGAATLDTPTGVAIDTEDNLWVADGDNDRVVVFLDPLTSDAVADDVLGQSGLSAHVNPTVASADNFGLPTAVFADALGNVFVSDLLFDRVLGYQRPLAAGAGTPGTPGASGDRTADVLFGQAAFTDDGCNDHDDVSGVSAQSLCNPAQVAVDSAGDLWVVDAGNHRVLRYVDALEGDDVADGVLGAPSFTSGASECQSAVRSASDFCNPQGLAIDADDDVWVADSGSNRVLVFE